MQIPQTQNKMHENFMSAFNSMFFFRKKCIPMSYDSKRNFQRKFIFVSDCFSHFLTREFINSQPVALASV